MSLQEKAGKLDKGRLISVVDPFRTQDKEVTSVNWNSDGKYIVSNIKHASYSLIHRFHEHGGYCNLIHTIKDHSNTIYKSQWHPSNPNILATTSSDKSIKLWNIKATGSSDKIVVDCISTIETETVNTDLIWHPSGLFIAVVDRSSNITLINMETRLSVASIPSSSEISSPRWSPCGNFFFVPQIATTCGEDYPLSIYIFKSDTGEVEFYTNIAAHIGPCTSLAFDFEGRYFATGGRDGIVSIFETENLTCVASITHIERVSYEANPTETATAGVTLMSGEEVSALDFNKDGLLVVSFASGDFPIVADPETGKVLFHIQASGMMRDQRDGRSRDTQSFINRFNDANEKSMNVVSWHPRQWIIACGGVYARDMASSRNGLLTLLSFC
eukprot:TRINITY_DN936_c0_g1_i3.p1 TRINITY_DN936_c0_g1~~TRINITY_DN936_c0_g1_i3.p1  ORF type:complete len:386 (+),score=40.30 TRINITY_DN936_c0_g1_i3:460-1617(+)